MTQCSIPGPAPVVFMVPGNGVIVAIGTALVAGFVNLHQHMDVRIELFEIVPFILSFPGGWKVIR